MDHPLLNSVDVIVPQDAVGRVVDNRNDSVISEAVEAVEHPRKTKNDGGEDEGTMISSTPLSSSPRHESCSSLNSSSGFYENF